MEIARLQGRETIMCVEFDIPEEEALRRLIFAIAVLQGYRLHRGPLADGDNH